MMGATADPSNKRSQFEAKTGCMTARDGGAWPPLQFVASTNTLEPL
jgi:hypothetical protein